MNMLSNVINWCRPPILNFKLVPVAYLPVAYLNEYVVKWNPGKIHCRSRRMNVFIQTKPLLVAICIVFTTALLISCQGAVSPQVTPERVIGDFLRESGLGNMDAARAYAVPESAPMVETWRAKLYFPDHSNPPSAADETNLDKFIGNFYRVTLMESTDTEATVRLMFAPTDALIGFPSVADNPLVPTSAMFDVALRRDVQSDGEKPDFGDWKIVSLESARVGS